MNDVVKCVEGNAIKLFADDMKIYQNITSDDDMNLLCENVQRIFSWGNKWQLNFNASKCAMLHLGPPSYSVDGVTLNESICDCDLSYNITT